MITLLDGKVESRTVPTPNTMTDLKASIASSEKPSYAAVIIGSAAPKPQIKDIKIRETRKLLILESPDDKESVDQAREILSRAFDQKKERFKSRKSKREKMVRWLR